MQESSPHLRITPGQDGRLLTLHGSWSAAALAQPGAWQAVTQELYGLSALERGQAQWDLRTLDRMDHTGAQVLWNAWGRQWPAAVQTSPAQRAMLERVVRYTVTPPAVQALSPMQRFLALGEVVYKVVDHARDLMALIGQLLLDLRASHPLAWLLRAG